MADDELHHVTIRSRDEIAGLVGQLRDAADGHIHGDVTLVLHEGERVIELDVDDLEPVRQVVRQHGAEETTMEVDVPVQRLG